MIKRKRRGTDTWSPQITSIPQLSQSFQTRLSTELFTGSEIALPQCNLLSLLPWASAQSRVWGLNRFSFLFFLCCFSIFLWVWLLPATFSWALGKRIVGLSILSTIVNSVSFFQLPRVISCSGLLSYFQINYFQDSYSYICSEKFHSWPCECFVSGWSQYIFTATLSLQRHAIKKAAFGTLYRKGKRGFCYHHL